MEEWSSDDQLFMEEALGQAKEAWYAGEVPVGCVFVDRTTNTIISKACNATNRTKNGTMHCEFVAMEHIINTYGKEKLADCTLYVTVEPCIMCTGALQYAGVTQCVYGCGNERFGGCGSVHGFHKPVPEVGLKGLSCRSGLLADKAILVLKEFYARGNPNAPEEKRARSLKPRGELSI